ncbi:hypothetical protein GCM10009760_22850 [Kitasatospora kazusensis]|uniref:FXSXX-COOH protein n=1 Tax=Kitasatospora kazusensis TaxID=407974 RepID=A0ABP5L0C3_9ACTN
MAPIEHTADSERQLTEGQSSPDRVSLVKLAVLGADGLVAGLHRAVPEPGSARDTVATFNSAV